MIRLKQLFALLARFYRALNEEMQRFFDGAAFEVSEREYSEFWRALDDSPRIEDGHGNWWHKRCPRCGRNTMKVVSPGKAQCTMCG